MLSEAKHPGATAVLLLSLAHIAIMSWVMFRCCRVSRCSPLYVLLFFPASAISLGIVCAGIVKRFSSKGIVWRGRRYDSRDNFRFSG